MKRARMFQVLVVYLGASWAVLQVAQLLQESLSLPEWVVPVALLLLIIGLLVIVATAWVQSLPSTRTAVESGAEPGAWEVAPGGIFEAIREGELPHLTWGRAILGGVFALWLLFGFAGLYVVIQDRGESFAPEELVADVAGDGIAIVPFTVRGEEFEVWREGMVDVFAISLDDVGGFRTIDSRTLMARWNEAVPEGSDADLATAREVARRAGARYVMIGSAVSLGSDVRLAAELVEVETGRNVGTGQVEGSADSISALADQLSVEVIGTLLREEGSDILTSHQAASLTTSSLPALKAYLEAEAHYRNSAFVPAIEAYLRALEADSAFALAHWRLAEAYGWMENIGSERAGEHYAAVERFVDRLRPRDRAILEGNAALVRGDLEAFDAVERTTEKYPDDPEAWFLLGEFYVHLGEPLLANPEETRRVLEKAVELDPSFGPYYIHLIEYAMFTGDTASSRELLERYGDISSQGPGFHRLALGVDLFLGDSIAQARARAALDTVPDRILLSLWGNFSYKIGRPTVQHLVVMEADSRGIPVGSAPRGTLVAAGRLDEHAARRADPGLAPDVQLTSRFDEIYWGGADLPMGEVNLVDCGEAANVSRHCSMLVATLAVSAGDMTTARAAAAGLRGAAAELRASGDTIWADENDLAATMIDAYAFSLDQGPDIAIRELEELQGRSRFVADAWTRFWLAELNVAAGRDAQAIPYYRSLWVYPSRSYADLQIGRAYERLGREKDAIEAYTDFLQAYEEADAGHPWQEEARTALDRLLTARG